MKKASELDEHIGDFVFVDRHADWSVPGSFSM
jgi:hypothetical protein